MSLPQRSDNLQSTEIILVNKKNNQLSNSYLWYLSEQIKNKIGDVKILSIDKGEENKIVANNALQIEISEKNGIRLEAKHGHTPNHSSLLLLELVKAIYNESAKTHFISKTINNIKISRSSFQTDFSTQRDKQILTVGLICMSIMSTCFFGFSVILVQLRASNALKIFKVMPVSSLTYIISFMLCRVIIILFFAIVFLIVADFLYGLAVPYSLLNLVRFSALVSIGALTFISIGLMVACRITSVSAANGIINTLYFPLIFLSGLFFPISSEMEWLDTIASYLPLREYAEMFHQIVFDEASFMQFKDSLFLMAVWGGVPFFISQKKFVWNAEN